MPKDAALELHAHEESSRHRAIMKNKPELGERLCAICNVSTSQWVEIIRGIDVTSQKGGLRDWQHDDLTEQHPLYDHVHCIPCFCGTLETKDLC